MASYQIKQSSTAYPLVFLMVDSTDHVTGKTGLTPTVTLSKAGGSFASPAGAVSEISAGWYKVAGNATDTGTLGPLALHATGTAADPTDMLYEVVAHDVQDTVRLGLTALPNVASGSAGAIPTVGTGTAQISVSSGQVILQSGTGTGQLSFTSGVVKADMTAILATTLTETSGLLAGGFKKFFNVATPTGTLNSIPDAVAGATGGLFIAGTNAATTITTSLTTTFTGNLTGSVASVSGAVGSVTGAVGSVTGAVGSVTGNVGGNVVGTVASVVGAVGSVTGNVGGNVVGTVASVVGNVGGVAGTTQTFDALQTALNSAHGSGSWATATSVTVSDKTGFSLSASGLAAISAWTVNITGTLSGNVGGIAGTTTTLDALQTALNSAHGSGSWATATGFSTLDAAGVRTAVGLGSANLDTQFAALPTAAAVATAVFTTAMTEAYAADGSTFTLAQGMYMIFSTLAQFSITSTTLTTYKLDGTTPALVFTLDSATDPTSRTRAA